MHRTTGGIRDYTEDDLKWVSFAKCMRSAGLPVEALIEYVALCQQGDSTSEARKQILLEQRRQLISRMEELQQTLDPVSYTHLILMQVAAVESALQSFGYLPVSYTHLDVYKRQRLGHA